MRCPCAVTRRRLKRTDCFLPLISPIPPLCCHYPTLHATRATNNDERPPDFAYLCMPQFPWACGSGSRKRTRSAPFYALDSQLPIFLTLICGLQHALAMLAGLITPPIIFAGQLGFSPAQQTQMVAVSLIASGFLSMVQMTRFPIPFTRRKYWMGTGLVTVVRPFPASLGGARDRRARD